MLVSYFYDSVIPNRLAAPIQILSTCRALAELGVRVTLYTRRIVGGAADCLAFYGLSPHEDLRLVPLLESRLPRRVDLGWRLRGALRESAASGHPHVVISRGEAGVALFDRLRRIERAPAERRIFEMHRLCFAHDVERREGRRWRGPDDVPAAVRRLRSREEAAIEGADGIVCLSEGLRGAVEANFHVARPTLILPSGTTLPPTEPAGIAPPRDIDILYMGKLERRKGVPGLVEAMPHLPGRRLWIVGGSPTEVGEISDLAGRLGVADRVTLTGFVEPGQVRQFWRRARVGVCPLPVGECITSEVFTSPLKILEMMAYGVPIVATDLPAVREILRDGRDAMLVPPGDPTALATAIGRLLDDPALADRISREAFARVADYSWSSRARRLLDFLRSLCHEGAAACGPTN